MHVQISEEKLIPSIPTVLSRGDERIYGILRFALPRRALWMILLMKSVWIRWNSDRKNLIHGYYEDAYLKPIAANTNGIFECLEKEQSIFTGMRNGKHIRTRLAISGVELVWHCFSYKTGVWPISLEIAGARLSLNQDRSVQLQVGATEIGQGARILYFPRWQQRPYIWIFQGAYCNPAGYRCDAFLIQVRMLPDSPLSPVQP